MATPYLPPPFSCTPSPPSLPEEWTRISQKDEDPRLTALNQVAGDGLTSVASIFLAFLGLVSHVDSSSHYHHGDYFGETIDPPSCDAIFRST